MKKLRREDETPPDIEPLETVDAPPPVQAGASDASLFFLLVGVVMLLVTCVVFIVIAS